MDTVVYVIEENNKFSPDAAVKESMQIAISRMIISDHVHIHQTESLGETMKLLSKMTNLIEQQYKDRPIYVIPDGKIRFDSYGDLKKFLRNECPDMRFVTSFETFMNMLSKSETLSISDVYIKMLMTVKGVTSAKALHIQKLFPTFRSLFDKLASLPSDEDRRLLLFTLCSDSSGNLESVSKQLSSKIAQHLFVSPS